MKNRSIQIISAMLLLTVMFVLTSCKKWLDVQPSTRLDRSEIFKTEGGYRDAILGVYSNLSSGSLYGREMTYGTMDVLAGYYYPAFSGSNIYYNFYWSYPYKRDNTGKINACVAIIDSMWTGMYNQVANLNSIIETIDDNKSVFTGDNYSILKGEAIGLRAFIHLDLLRMYGPGYQVNPAQKSIPFVDTLSSLISPLLTVEQAANRIISELETAKALMEKDPINSGGTPSAILASSTGTGSLAPYHNRRYHFNYYAVKATLARAYLWKGDKVNALKYAKEVISAQAARFPWVLDANLTAISSTSTTNKDRTFTTEHIFALNVRALESDIPEYFTSAGLPGNQLLSSSSTKNSIYESNTIDPRNQYLFTANGSSFFSTKLYQDDITSTWFKYQMPVIRISEMYYIAAECEPGLSAGLDWLNTIRQVRKLSALSTTNINSYDKLMIEIQKEYQKEFIGEGQLWYFYKRLNMTSLPYAMGFFDPKLYVFDMPDNEYTFGGR